jgi:acyl carrier protein
MSDGTQPVKLTYREAMREAIREAMHNDERVFLMGEDVGRYGGCFAVSKGLLQEFGSERIRDTPLSESSFVGAGIGAAMGGMRPIVEIMTVNFSLLAADQILNNAATILHMSGGQFNIPLVIRMTTGGGRQVAAQHSHCLEGWYAHIPGIKVVTPAIIEDARGMLWTAIEDPDPVLMFENVTLYGMEGELAADVGPVGIDRARVRRAGHSGHPSCRPQEPGRADGSSARLNPTCASRPAAQLGVDGCHDHRHELGRSGGRGGVWRHRPAASRTGGLWENHRTTMGGAWHARHSTDSEGHPGRGPPRHRRTPWRSIPRILEPLPAGASLAMTETQIKEVIVTGLGRIAPEADLSTLDPAANVREALDIDSFDHLNLLIGLHDELGVEIPEADYSQLSTLADIITYLSARLR